MASFRETREVLLFAHQRRLIKTRDFVLLYDLNKSKNLDFPYWNYTHFDLDQFTNDECVSQFRFQKMDVYRLKDVLLIPDEIVCYNRSVFNGTEAFCGFLRRFAYPCRYADMVEQFGRSVPELCLMTNYILDHIYTNFGHLLNSFEQNWLSPFELQGFADCIHQKGASLANCWGFIDGTVRPISRPGENQRIMYNGHKRVHALKFQPIVAPNGLIANLFGPVEGRRHDSGMLALSGLLPLLNEHSRNLQGELLCIYGDPAYPLRPSLHGPFRGNPNQEQKDYNKAMSQVRISVEWVFNDITNYFKFMDFKKNLKIELSAIGKMYLVCALLTNARTCLYGSITSAYFNKEPPVIEDYFTIH